MVNAVIVDSVRTGLAKSFRGGFNSTRADDMTAHIVNALMERNPEVDPGLVEDIILGSLYLFLSSFIFCKKIILLFSYFSIHSFV